MTCEHATDDTLTPAAISVLRLIAAGNAAPSPFESGKLRTNTS